MKIDTPGPLLVLLATLIGVSEEKPVYDRKAALVIIDVQNCFVHGGTLGVAEGDQVIDVINQIRQKYEKRFSLVVLSQDWHCADHVSFASQHSGQSLYDVIDLKYDDQGNLCKEGSNNNKYAVQCDGSKKTVKQTLWPDHCVINTTDADIHRNLTMSSSDVIVRKGYHCDVDSYSAFFDNGGFQQTELAGVLSQADINTVYIAGLATDFCVYYTALDALRLGYITYVIEDATRPVTPQGGVTAVADMKKKGIYLLNSDEVGETLPLPDVEVEKFALMIIDVQNCFVPGGTLAVNEGDLVIDVINDLRSKFSKQFDLVVMSQDWHCKDHVSFASQHPGSNPYDQVVLQYNINGSLCYADGMTNQYSRNCSSVAHNVTQTLWPDHCVKNTNDASFHSKLVRQNTDIVVRKGYHCHIDSYSTFFDNGDFTQTEMNDILKEHGITTLHVVGLATDYCVYHSALDAKRLGYKTFVVLDATRGVAPDTTAAAIADMNRKGVLLINSTDVGNTLPSDTSGAPSLSHVTMTSAVCLAWWILSYLF